MAWAGRMSGCGCSGCFPSRLCSSAWWWSWGVRHEDSTLCIRSTAHDGGGAEVEVCGWNDDVMCAGDTLHEQPTSLDNACMLCCDVTCTWQPDTRCTSAGCECVHALAVLARVSTTACCVSLPWRLCRLLIWAPVAAGCRHCPRRCQQQCAAMGRERARCIPMCASMPVHCNVTAMTPMSFG